MCTYDIIKNKNYKWRKKKKDYFISITVFTKACNNFLFNSYTFIATSRSSQPRTQQKGKQNIPKSKPAGKDDEPPVRILKRHEDRGCRDCEDCLLEGEKLLRSDDTKEGYEQLLEVISSRHRSDKHYGLVRKAVGQIVAKLGEAAVPGRSYTI